MPNLGTRPVTERYFSPMATFSGCGRFEKHGKRFYDSYILETEYRGRESPGPVRPINRMHNYGFGRNRTGALYPPPQRPSTSAKTKKWRRLSVTEHRAAEFALQNPHKRKPLSPKLRGVHSPGPAGYDTSGYMSHLRPKTPNATLGTGKRFWYKNPTGPGPTHTYLSQFDKHARELSTAEIRERGRRIIRDRSGSQRLDTTRRKVSRMKPRHENARRTPFGKVYGQASPGPMAYSYNPGFDTSMLKLRARLNARTRGNATRKTKPEDMLKRLRAAAENMKI